MCNRACFRDSPHYIKMSKAYQFFVQCKDKRFVVFCSAMKTVKTLIDKVELAYSESFGEKVKVDNVACNDYVVPQKYFILQAFNDKSTVEAILGEEKQPKSSHSKIPEGPHSELNESTHEQ